MKRYVILSFCVLAAAAVYAQETYESARFTDTDLNGTARYVGMGGAMEALGADISTISTNPAGIGMFRHSKESFSGGLIMQQDAADVSHGNKTNVSFDQLGFVFALPNGSRSWFNFAFNYSKSRNFNYILKAADALDQASQNKWAYIKGARGSVSDFGYDPAESSSSDYLGYEDVQSDYTANTFSQVDYLYWNSLIPDDDGNFYYNDASGYLMQRAEKGYIGRYDFNLSGNIQNKYFLGVTFGLSDVHYKGYSQYSETLLYADGEEAGEAVLIDNRKITGTGFDVKLGMIFRPIETSPFRIGIYLHTPTWYTLTTSNDTYLNHNISSSIDNSAYIGEDYDYRVNTPWKVGLSLGHTIGQSIALGLTYEYCDYSKLDNRIKDYDSYEYDGYCDSYSDDVMNSNTELSLKGVHMLKLGGELKPDEHLSIRLGYNYISPKYYKDGFKDLCIDSPGAYYASQTDYTNWKSTNRITCGFGYATGPLTFDLAYQYSQISGDFYPFSSEAVTIDNESVSTYVDATNVENKRHQLLFTFGYTF